MKTLGARFGLCFSSLLILVSCGGGSGDTPVTVTGNANDSAFISGQVIDGITGIPIENALVTTTPPTEARLTDLDGRYEIVDEVFEGEVFDVTARQVGYDSDSRRITVANGSFAIADFSIVTAVNGLVSSVPSLEIARGESSATFLLSSTIADTPFSFTTTNPAFSVSPATGSLAKNEHLVIQADFTPDSDDSGRVTGQLIGNTGNGGTGVEINIVANIADSDLSGVEDPFEILISDPNSVGIGLADNTNLSDSNTGNNISNSMDTEMSGEQSPGNDEDLSSTAQEGPTSEPMLISTIGQTSVQLTEFPTSAAINDELEFPEELGLNAPAWRFTGSTVRVSWRNPETDSTIRIANPSDPADVFFNTGFSVVPDSRGTGSGTIRIPFTPGTYELRMIRSGEILASRFIEAVPALIQANDSGLSGGVIEVDWAGPLRNGSTMRIAELDAPYDEFFNTGFSIVPTSTGVGSGTLAAPFTPGNYEIRIISGSVVISRLPYTVFPPILSAAASGPSGSSTEVTWAGPRRNGSTVRIARPEDPFDVFFNTGFSIVPDSTGMGSGFINVPFSPGIYEIRILLGNGTITAAIPFEAVPPTISGPEMAFAGENIEVDWAGPTRNGSTVRLSRPNDPVDVFFNTGFSIVPDSTGMGSGTIRMPSEPGEYEVRIVIDGSEILASYTIIVI